MSRIWWKKSPAQITLFCPRAVASSAAAAGGENESARSEIMAGRDRSSLNGLDIFCFNPHCDARYVSRQDLFGSVPFPLYNSLCLPYHLPITLLPHLMSRSMSDRLGAQPSHPLNGNGKKFFEQKIFPTRFYSLLEAQQ